MMAGGRSLPVGLAMIATAAGHTLACLLAQIAVGATTGDWWMGGLLGIAFFWGREQAQAQRKAADAIGVSAKRMPWYSGLAPWSWSLDGRLDLLPAAAAVLLLGAL